MSGLHGQATVGAAITERQLKDQAHTLMMKGQLEPALEVYRQLIRMNGKAPLYRLRHAELSVRVGRQDAAVASYRIAAHLLREAGRNAQAKAVLHTAMQLAPLDMSLRRQVKELIIPTPPPQRVMLGFADEAVTEPCLLPLGGEGAR